MEGTGEGCGFFCSPKLPYLSLNNFVADCSLTRPYYAVHNHVWPYIALHGHAWPYIAVNSHTKPYITVHSRT